MVKLVDKARGGVNGSVGISGARWRLVGGYVLMGYGEGEVCMDVYGK